MRIYKSTIWTAAATATFCAAGIYVAASGERLGAQGGPQITRPSGEEIAARNERTYGFKGVITGRVTLSDGKPAVGFPVVARFVMHQTGAQGEGEAITDTQGRYRIHGLSPQGFGVQAGNGGKPYLVESWRIVHLEKFPNATVANVDFTLRLGPQITVRVHDAQTGVPVAGTIVNANQSAGTSPFPVGATDARGEFRFRTGQWETEMRLDEGKHQGRDINAAPGYSSYRRVKFNGVADLHDVTWDVKTYSDDPRLNAVVLRGVVTGSDGRPVPGATVRLVRGGGGGVLHARAATDAAGRFSFPTYRMRISEYYTGNRWRKGGILIEARKGSLSALHLATPDETWTTIPVRLSSEERPFVTGHAVFPNGKPAAGVPIRYSEAFLDVSAYSEKNGGATDANGRFTIRALSPDAYYQFRFGGWYLRYGGNPGFGETRVPDVKYTSGQMRLKRGEWRRDLGRVVIWPASSVVAGRLVGPNGGPPRGSLLVTLKGKHTNVLASPTPDGRFRAERVVREPLTLTVDRIYSNTSGEVARKIVRAGDQAVKVVVP